MLSILENDFIGVESIFSLGKNDFFRQSLQSAWKNQSGQILKELTLYAFEPLSIQKS